MKKIFAFFLISGLLVTFLSSCGDEKDEPMIIKSLLLESDDDETGARIVFDIDLDRDSSSIYIYNAIINMGGEISLPMNVRIDSPCSVDKAGKVYTYSGTNIVPFILRGNTPVPTPSILVTNFTCVVNTENKTYFTEFDCRSSHYSKSGAIK